MAVALVVALGVADLVATVVPLGVAEAEATTVGLGAKVGVGSATCEAKGVGKVSVVVA